MNAIAKLSKTDRLEISEAIRRELVEGTPEPEVQEALGLDAETYEEIKGWMLEDRAGRRQRQTAGQTFAEYEIAQRRNILDLDALIDTLNCKKQHNIVVGAIRLRADLEDRIIARGQELGIIAKAPSKSIVVGGLAISSMTDRELKKAIVSSLDGLKSLQKRFGDRPIDEVEPGDLHFGPALKSLPTTGEEVPTVEAEEPDRIKAAKAKAAKKKGQKR